MTRTYLKCADVKQLLGCASSKAYEVIKQVNEYAEKNKLLPFPKGTASKYIFSKLYGIPIEDINAVIENIN